MVEMDDMCIRNSRSEISNCNIHWEYMRDMLAALSEIFKP